MHETGRKIFTVLDEQGFSRFSTSLIFCHCCFDLFRLFVRERICKKNSKTRYVRRGFFGILVDWGLVVPDDDAKFMEENLEKYSGSFLVKGARGTLPIRKSVIYFRDLFSVVKKYPQIRVSRQKHARKFAVFRPPVWRAAMALCVADRHPDDHMYAQNENSPSS